MANINDFCTILDRNFDRFCRPRNEPLADDLIRLNLHGKSLMGLQDPEAPKGVEYSDEAIAKLLARIPEQEITPGHDNPVTYNASLLKARQVQKELQRITYEKHLKKMPEFLQPFAEFIDSVIRIFEERIYLHHSPDKEKLQARLSYSPELNTVIVQARSLDDSVVAGSWRIIPGAQHRLLKAVAKLSPADQASFWDQRYRDRQLAEFYTRLEDGLAVNKGIRDNAKKEFGLALQNLKDNNANDFDKWCMNRISKAAYDIEAAILELRKAHKVFVEQSIEDLLTGFHQEGLASRSINMCSRVSTSEDLSEQSPAAIRCEADKHAAATVFAQMVRFFQDYKKVWLSFDQPSSSVLGITEKRAGQHDNDLGELGFRKTDTTDSLNESIEQVRAKLDLDMWQYMLAA